MPAENRIVPKPGDLVRLKSGGPLMTFVRIQVRDGSKPGDREEAYCVWFSADGVAQAGAFPVTALTSSR